MLLQRDMPRSASQTASVAYKPWREELPNILLHFVKGPMLATLFLWFVVCNDRVLPSVLRWASLEVDWCALPGAAWLLEGAVCRSFSCSLRSLWLSTRLSISR